ncbi:MAG TPA: hypothetical protein VFS39_00585 [Nitrospira sp.]|nr:hypothetical protein [Nitrospira sp.]
MATRKCQGLYGTVVMSALAAAAFMVFGCSSDHPKPMAQPTPDQVRGHADRTFDKLKQEEQERNVQAPVSR